MLYIATSWTAFVKCGQERRFAIHDMPLHRKRTHFQGFSSAFSRRLQVIISRWKLLSLTSRHLRLKQFMNASSEVSSLALTEMFEALSGGSISRNGALHHLCIWGWDTSPLVPKSHTSRYTVASLFQVFLESTRVSTQRNIKEMLLYGIEHIRQPHM